MDPAVELPAHVHKLLLCPVPAGMLDVLVENPKDLLFRFADAWALKAPHCLELVSQPVVHALVVLVFRPGRGWMNGWVGERMDTWTCGWME